MSASEIEFCSRRAAQEDILAKNAALTVIRDLHLRFAMLYRARCAAALACAAEPNAPIPLFREAASGSQAQAAMEVVVVKPRNLRELAAVSNSERALPQFHHAREA